MKKIKGENHRGVSVLEPADRTAITNHAAFLSANPEARLIHEEHVREFRTVWAAFEDGLRPVLHAIVDKAEQLRQLGGVMTEIARSLPFGKFTRDFYEQMKHEFTDATGQSIGFELLEWSIRVAKDYPDPITGFNEAIKCRQCLLLATGEDEFRLEATATDRGSVVKTADSLRQMRSLLDAATWKERAEKFFSDTNYFKNGKLVEHQRDLLIEEWREPLEIASKMKTILGL